MTAFRPPPRLTGDDAGDLRSIHNWQQQLFNDVTTAVNAIEVQLAAIAALEPLAQSISNPPTQTEVAAVQAKVNAIIAAAAST